MNPAFSVIFLTTLIGAGQGLFLALFGAELAGFVPAPADARGFFVIGGVVALRAHRRGARGLVLPPRPARARLALGGACGAPRGCRARSSRCRCSWACCSSGLLQPCRWLPHWTPALGRAGGAGRALALFVCTAHGLRLGALPAGMGHAAHAASTTRCWAWPRASRWPRRWPRCRCAGSWCGAFGAWALVFTLAGLVSRGLSLARNARLKPRSTLQTRDRHPAPADRAALDGLHGRFVQHARVLPRQAPAQLRAGEVGLPAAVPSCCRCALLALGLTSASARRCWRWPSWCSTSGCWPSAGSSSRRRNHPQNLYYQAVS